MALTVDTDHDTIRAQRRSAGLTQQQLAQVAGCSIAYVQLIEQGYSPRPDTSPVFRRVLACLGEAACKTGGVEPGA